MANEWWQANKSGFPVFHSCAMIRGNWQGNERQGNGLKEILHSPAEQIGIVRGMFVRGMNQREGARALARFNVISLRSVALVWTHLLVRTVKRHKYRAPLCLARA